MKKVYVLLSFIFPFEIHSAQDVQFSMPYSAPLYFNPALAGSDGCSRITGSYRNQSPNISGSYVYSSVSYDQYIKVLHGGLGLSYYNEKAAGTFTKNRISGIYSAHIPVFKHKWVVKPAVEGTYGRNYIDYSKLTFGSYPCFSSFGNNKVIVTYFDLSSGILLYSKRFYGGFALHHINEPDEYFTQCLLSKKYTGHFGINISICDSGKVVTINPSMHFISQQDFRSVLFRCSVHHGPIVLAIGYRDSDNMIISFGWRIKSFSITYSYDWSIPDLGNVTTGSHEIALSFFFNKKAKPEGFLPFDSASF